MILGLTLCGEEAKKRSRFCFFRSSLFGLFNVGHYENLLVIIGKLGKWAFNCHLLAAVVVLALSSLVPLEQSQVQLVINVYPSQDNPTSQAL